MSVKLPTILRALETMSPDERLAVLLKAADLEVEAIRKAYPGAGEHRKKQLQAAGERLKAGKEQLHIRVNQSRRLLENFR